MVKKQKLYVARLIGWLNCRYYVIEIHHRLYAIDYANPRDVRTYFPGFFPKYNRQYMVYDITATQDQYTIRPVSWWQGYFRKFIESGFAVLLLVMASITSRMRMGWLYNQNILQFWKIILLLYVIGAVGIILWLNRINKAPFGLLEEKRYQLERLPQLRYVGVKRRIRVGPVGDFMLTLFGQAISLIFILNYSYIIILLGFISGYSILFIRFLNLYEILNMNKFIFLEEDKE